jgi:hypothetical protein
LDGAPRRAAAWTAASFDLMGAPSKKARNVMTSGQFELQRLLQNLQAPLGNWGAFSWDLDRIYAARTQQELGRFKLPALLAESTRTDDSIFHASESRLAPEQCIQVGIKPARGARGIPIANEADAQFGAKGVALRPETRSDIHRCLVDHGVAFASCTTMPREDGSRLDMSITAWPIRHVWWDPVMFAYKTETRTGMETIVHGDGRWLVFSKHEREPHKHGAILPISLVWAAHAFSIRDWAKGSVSHGNAKMVGEMPAGVPLQDADGNLTPEALAFIELLRGLMTNDTPVGLRPAGSKTDFEVNTSTAWQVWMELAKSREQAAARVYLGTDGVLGAQGGAPGVDIGQLFGVAETRVEGDLTCLERGFNTAIDVWTALNFGDSSLAPRYKYLIPDTSLEKRTASYATRRTAFYDDIARARAAGFVVDQDFADLVAAKYGVDAPTLGDAPPAAAAPAPTTTPPAPAQLTVVR